MFKAVPPPLADPMGLNRIHPPDDLRQHALELVLAEIKYQPVLKLRAFCTGLIAGIALVVGLELGYSLGVEGGTAIAQAAAHMLPELPAARH